MCAGLYQIDPHDVILGPMSNENTVFPSAADSTVKSRVIELPHLPTTARTGIRLLLETMVIPTLILLLCVRTVGSFWGFVAILGWCAATLAIRWFGQGRLPGTLILAFGMVVGRSSISLALSSVYVYLLQPVVGSIFMALLFLGSAAIGRPITMRLAQDFVTLPSHLLHDKGVRRLFAQVCVLWGCSRLLDAGMSLGVLHWGIDAGLMSRSVLSTLLTAVSIAVCGYWGWTRLSRTHGVVFRKTGYLPA